MWMHRFVARIAIMLMLAGVGVTGAVAASANVADEPVDLTTFVNFAAQTGRMAVEAARVALVSTKNPAVTEYAYRIIHHHEKMNADLATIADKRGNSLPAELDVQHARALQALRDTPSGKFDIAYLASMAAEHARVEEWLQSNLLNADTEVAVFSSYNLPMVKEHKRLAEELKAKLTS
jgi:putative membrane protein